jgi:hypothetical protein
MSFEPNQGQSDPSVKFVSRGLGYTSFFAQGVVMFALNKPPCRANSSLCNRKEMSHGALLTLKWLGADSNVQVSGLDEMSARTTYFIGKNHKDWKIDVPNYARVRYANLYPGVDVVYYGNNRRLEFDLVLAPGANPEMIGLRLGGTRKTRINTCGDLVLHLRGGVLQLKRPVAYQQGDNGKRKFISSRYVMRASSEVGIQLSNYDQSKTIVVDPVLVYSTYLGGTLDDFGAGITVDREGNAYVAGGTFSGDFPLKNALQQVNKAGPVNRSAFVTKFDRDGDALIYSTYLGGSGDTVARAIAVDSWGRVYVSGETQATDFPTRQPLQKFFGGGLSDAFVAKLDRDGDRLLYSTYLGGNGDESAESIAIDRSGHAYVTGPTNSTNFPIRHAFQTNFAGGFSDAFISKLDRDGDQLVYSTYLGGGGEDDAFGITVDNDGHVYVTGETGSSDFPTKDAFQRTFGGGDFDAFVAKFDRDGDRLVYSTFLGGNGTDSALGIAIDHSNNAYIVGATTSSNFPTQHAVQNANHGGSTGFDAFVTELDSDGDRLVYSTYLGGSGDDFGLAIAVDRRGNAFLTGFTQSFDFPIQNELQAFPGGFNDPFVTQIDADGDHLEFSTYLGGSVFDQGLAIAVGSRKGVYVTGIAFSTDFPTKNAFQDANAGSNDVFVSKIGTRSKYLKSKSIRYGTSVGGANGAADKSNTSCRGGVQSAPDFREPILQLRHRIPNMIVASTGGVCP